MDFKNNSEIFDIEYIDLFRNIVKLLNYKDFDNSELPKVETQNRYTDTADRYVMDCNDSYPLLFFNISRKYYISVNLKYCYRNITVRTKNGYIWEDQQSKNSYQIYNEFPIKAKSTHYLIQPNRAYCKINYYPKFKYKNFIKFMQWISYLYKNRKGIEKLIEYHEDRINIRNLSFQYRILKIKEYNNN